MTIKGIESCADIPDCMKAEKIRIVTQDDEYIGMQSELILHGTEAQKEM